MSTQNTSESKSAAPQHLRRTITINASDVDLDKTAIWLLWSFIMSIYEQHHYSLFEGERKEEKLLLHFHSCGSS